MKGAYVSDVNEDLGASEAGIRKGDVIVSVNGIEINNSSELQEQVSRYRPGDKVRVLAFRGAKQIEFNVPLKPLGGSIQVASNTRGATEIKGSSFRLLSAEEYRRLDISNGVMVEEAGEKMTKGGIQDGFVITEIDGIEIQSIEDLEEALNKSDEYITMKGLYNKGMIASYSFSW